MSNIAEAKQKLPLPPLMQQLGFGEHAKKSARCPFHEDRHNSFSVWQRHDGSWLFKCHAGCGQGDEIDFIARHKNISKREAIKLFFEMAGVAQTRKGPFAQKANGETPPVDWQRCVEAFSQKYLEWLAEWRGYSGKFCSWLHKAELVGLWRKRVAGVWQDHICFPLHNDAGEVVAVHYWQKDDQTWRYYPQGAKVHPLVIGELKAGERIHPFESQWDGFAFMDVSGERSGIIVTRGAGNGALVAGLISESSTVYAWTQNDVAGEKWERDICANTKPVVKRAKIPAPHKDLNDWTRAGATADDLLASAEQIQQASVAREPSSWGKPKLLPADLPDVPAFNLDCLPDTLRGWITDSAERMQCPPDFPAVGAMVVLGSLVGRKIGIRPKRHDDWLVIPNLWGGVVGRPGLLKSPGTGACAAAPSRGGSIRKTRSGNARARNQRHAENAAQEIGRKQYRQAPKGWRRRSSARGS